MKIVVDAFGGDYAPDEVIEGTIYALQSDKDLHVVLVGDKDKIIDILEHKVYVSNRLEIIHAPDVITSSDDPVKAIKTKKTSSIMVAFDYLKAKKDAVALVTAGSTDATLGGALLKLGKIKGIDQPALAPLIPTYNDSNVMLLDCGAYAECNVKNLIDYAIMGSEYMKATGVKNPKIALLNMGIDSDKGRAMHVEAYKQLQNSALNFVGNIEARDILRGDADVVVTDAFSGNVCLKTIEGTAEIVYGEIKEVMERSLRAKMAASVLKKGFLDVAKKYDYRRNGGAPMLGVGEIVVKCHGNSQYDSIATAILQAYELAQNKLIDKITKAVEKNAKK